jgi:hypothetical protein
MSAKPYISAFCITGFSYSAKRRDVGYFYPDMFVERLE